MWLRQSTAGQEILLGRFVDSTNGDTEETALTIANTDIKLWKEGATTLANKNSGGATHIANGLYYCVLDATDTNTLGNLEVHVHVTGALAIKREFQIVPAVIYDALILGTDNIVSDLSAAAVDAIFDEPLTGHTTNQTAGKVLKGIDEGWVSAEASVNDASATAISFISDLTNATDSFYSNQVLVFITGTLKGQGRVILSYNGTTKALTFDEAFTSAPADTDQFIILTGHIHPKDEIADAVWDETLTAATHNVATSAGRRLRQVEAAFVTAAGKAQTGTANTITLAAGESSTDDIFAGDRVIIVAGTGVGEHGIATSYNGTTKVCTMSQNWVITPDNTSEYELVPADADIETWQHVTVTNGSTSNLPVVDSQAISDSTAAADNVQTNIGNLDGAISAVLSVLPTSRVADDVTFSGTGTTTTCTLALVDGATPSSTNDQYKGRILLFDSGALDKVVTDITAYDGATKVATVTAVPVAITSSHTAKLI